MSVQYRLVVTGDIIPIEHNTLIGHGVENNGIVKDNNNSIDNNNNNDILNLIDDTVIATVSGYIERINKLITVHSLHTRYNGSIGDIVIGRVIHLHVYENKWAIDINSQHNATLSLNNIYLQNIQQRRTTIDDSIIMSNVLSYNDIICAEIQKISHIDNHCILQTRSIRYGKLFNGQLCIVNSNLIKRCKQHFQSLHNEINIDIILGINGYIWVYDPTQQPNRDIQNMNIDVNHNDNDNNSDNTQQGKTHIYNVFNDDLIRTLHTSESSRQRIIRVIHCINILAQYNKLIWNNSITRVYIATLQLNISLRELCNPAVAEKVVNYAENSNDVT